jgi:hypothetical protein
MRTLALAAALAAALAVPAAAQDRPGEDELFGGPSAPTGPTGPSGPTGPTGPTGRSAAPEGSPRPDEAELFGSSSGTPATQPPPPESLIELARKQEDALRIGGQLFLRADTTWREDVAPSAWPLSSGNLLDLFLDARPNDRVRAFVLGRLFYDPTLENSTGPTSTGSGSLDPLLALLGGPGQIDNPRVALDQLWLNFDLGRRAFVTVGKQHVKWGVGKFWNPTDYLHRVARDPLATFDARTGTTMVKVHGPWEKRGWNLYGVALLEDTGRGATPSTQVGRVSAGGRAEIVLGAAELGLDGLVQNGRRPRFGADVSAGLWELDVYAELALRSGEDVARWETSSSNPAELAAYHLHVPSGPVPQVVLGGSWSHNYTDEDVVNVGAEYFYDQAGYDDPHVYPFLLAGAPDPASTPPFAPRDLGAYRPFYLGRHYAGVFVSVPRPGRWNDTTFTLSVLGNLSDKSFVARLDHSVLVLTYLRLETYVAGHLGTRGGEFRLGFELPDELVVEAGLPSGTKIGVQAPVLDVGVALKVSL